MPGHVHTLGILHHSRSRHDRHETFGDEENRDPGAGLAVNPTGDPVLDARMVEEEEPWPCTLTFTDIFTNIFPCNNNTYSLHTVLLTTKFLILKYLY